MLDVSESEVLQSCGVNIYFLLLYRCPYSYNAIACPDS